MRDGDFGGWQPIETAPRDGSRVLVVIRASEQGPGEVDLARWAKPHRSNEKCWISGDSDPTCEIVYADSEVLFWMPLPAHAPRTRSAVLASSTLPTPPDLSEREGSGI